MKFVNLMRVGLIACLVLSAVAPPAAQPRPLSLTVLLAPGSGDSSQFKTALASYLGVDEATLDMEAPETMHTGHTLITVRLVDATPSLEKAAMLLPAAGGHALGDDFTDLVVRISHHGAPQGTISVVPLPPAAPKPPPPRTELSILCVLDTTDELYPRRLARLP